MPNISIMTPELNNAVIRPAVKDVIDQLIEITNIPKDTRVLYIDYIQAGYQRGSTMAQQADNEHDRTAFLYGNQMAIDVDINYDEGNISSTAIRQAEQIPIFNDDKLGVIIKPIYSKTNIAINVRYRSSSPTEGKKWRDGIRMNISNMRDINLHDITYHFAVPAQFINILKEIHRLREATDPYNQDLQTYLAAHATTRFTNLSNQSGSQQLLAIAEKQMRVQGLYDFEIAPEKGEPDDTNSAWITTFTYNVSFDVPIAVNMRYPIMVHNQLLDEPFITYENESYDIDKVNKAYSMSLGAFAHFDVTRPIQQYNEPTKIINVPEFDDFHYTGVLKGTIPLMSVLCSIEESDKKQLLNLKDLGEFGIDSDVMEFLKDEYFYLTKPYKSVFFVSLYKFSGQVPDKEILVDSDLNVRSRFSDLSFRINHRVVFSILKDLTFLDREALIRLKKHKAAAIKVFKALQVNRGILNQIAHHVNFNSFMPDLADTGMSLQRLQMQYYQTNTVNTSYVISYNSVNKEELTSYKLRKPL